MIRWAFAALHLIALGIGLGAVWARARALSVADLKRAFYADNWWGLAAILWIGTGLVRAIAGLEKTPSYYAHNTWFRVKMALLIVILLLEIVPMSTLIRWRVRIARGEQPDTHLAPRLALISRIQALLVVLMVLAATAMARGYGST